MHIQQPNRLERVPGEPGVSCVPVEPQTFSAQARLIGAIHLTDAFEVDTTLSRVASRYRARGFRVDGVLQSELRTAVGRTGDIVLRAIAAEKTIKISLNLGKSSTGCRADSAALTTASGDLEATLDNNALDLLILNRFGRCEAEGGGMRSVIEKAFTYDIPLLIPVRPKYLSHWSKFASGLSVPLTPDFESVAGWCDSVLISG